MKTILEMTLHQHKTFGERWREFAYWCETIFKNRSWNFSISKEIQSSWDYLCATTTYQVYFVETGF